MQKIKYQKPTLPKDCMPLQTRRNTLFGLVTFAVSGSVFTGCQSKSSLQCAGKDQLSLSENMARKGRQYVEISKQGKENCTNCALFRASDLAEPTCGVCGVDGLSAHPQGYCISWAPISA